MKKYIFIFIVIISIGWIVLKAHAQNIEIQERISDKKINDIKKIEKIEQEQIEKISKKRLERKNFIYKITQYEKNNF